MCTDYRNWTLNQKESMKCLSDLLKASQELMDGPEISKENGLLFSSRAIDDSMLEVLEELFVSNRDLSPPLRLRDLKTFKSPTISLGLFKECPTLKPWK
jgi:hypothetical protein